VLGTLHRSVFKLFEFESGRSKMKKEWSGTNSIIKVRE